MIEKAITVEESEVEAFNYSRENGIIGWMDCGGSNLVKINEQMPGIVKMIITTRTPEQGCKAREKARLIGEANGVGEVPLVEFDLNKYEEEHGVYAGDYLKALNCIELTEESAKAPYGTPKISIEYKKDQILRSLKSTLVQEEIIVIRYELCEKFKDMILETLATNGLAESMPIFAAGGMALLSQEFVEYFDIINVHPGDLTKYDLKGLLRSKRMIVGDGWRPPAKAISAGHELLYSSTHKMTPEMDAGPVFMRGYALPVDQNLIQSKYNIKETGQLKFIGTAAQEALKLLGDHVIAGATFYDLFSGNWGMHNDMLTYKYRGLWKSTPNGIIIEDHVANHPETAFQRSKEFIDDVINKFEEQVYEVHK